MKGFLQNQYVQIFVVLLIFALGLIIWSFGRVDDRYVITVDGFNLKKSSEITVGQNSDIIFNKVPAEYMSLDFTRDSMSVAIDRSADTLLYYKVNGENPNLHLMSESTDIIVNYHDSQVVVSYGIIRDIFERYSSPSTGERITGSKPTEYIMLKHIIALMGNVDDTLVSEMMSDDLFRSFVHSKGGKFRVCILDRFTKYDGLGYAFKTTVAPVDSMYQVQFFKMSENVYKKLKPSNTDVVIDGIYYASKPTIITTEWGAGHASLKPVVGKDGLSVEVSFPKGVTYVENLDSLSLRASRTSDMMTVSQSENAFPIYNNIYLAAFSESVLPDFASLVLDDGKLSLIDTCNDTTHVRKSCVMYPQQQKVDLKSAADKVHVRTAVLNGRYWRSYCVFPTLLYLLMLAFGYLIFRERGKIRYEVNVRRVQDYYQYFCVLLTILYAYVLCKIFIAIKLSFTYPYFEKLSGIVVTSTSMILLLMTTITFLLNFSFLIQDRRRIPSRTIGARIKAFLEDRIRTVSVTILVLGYALCILSLYLMDQGNSLAMKQSYGNSAITFFSNPLDWTKSAGINDTHRSVCYTLFLVELVLLSIVTINVLWTHPKFSSAAQGIWTWFLNLSFVKPFVNAVVALLRRVVEKLRDMFDSDFVRTALVALVALFVVAFIPGNYATALITVVVVLALSRMVIPFDNLLFNDWKGVGKFTGKFALCMAVFVFAIIPDQGYMVAWLGMFCAVMIFPIMTYNVRYFNSEAKRNMSRMSNLYRISLITVLFVILIGMPALVSSCVKPEEVSWGRLSRRMEMFSRYDATRESGYRYSEADMEFMQIMCHYMQNYKHTGDPLSNDEHPLHKSVSTGQSPVVLNDVSVQAAFFGPLGLSAHLIFFVLLIVLLGVVQLFCFTSDYRDDGCCSFKMTRHRLTAVFIWIGASVYLYLSYLGLFPYTGRLIYGFGVDSVGEALEICVLFAFMAHVAVSCKEDKMTNGCK